MDNEIIQIKLDSKTYGWAIKAKKTFEFLTKKDGEIRLFSNLDLLRSYAGKIFPNPKDYDIYLIINTEDGMSEISLNYIVKIDDHYEFYANVGKYEIYESTLTKVMRVGYFIFEDGKEHGKRSLEDTKKSKKYFKDIRRSVFNVMQSTGFKDISSVKQIGKDELVASITGNTIKIHICTNRYLMEINQNRKAMNNRCLVFDKSMDKYLTFYCYVTADEYSKPTYQDYQFIDSILETIANDLNIEFEALDFNGYIVIDERDEYNNEEKVH